MKRLYLILIITFAFHGFPYAQWVADASNVTVVNTNKGNVGIGTASPTDKLEVAGAVDLLTCIQ